MHTHTHTLSLFQRRIQPQTRTRTFIFFPPFFQADLNLLAFVASVSSRRRCSKDAMYGLLFE